MKIISKNKRASFEYEFLDVYEAGVKLVGTEVKSIRANKCSINEAFCYFKDGELYIKNMHVAQHEECGPKLNHEVLRDRKLLLNKKELLKLAKGVETKGLTIVPLKIYLSDKGFIKIEISLCKGKKTYDKKNSIKEKDIERDTKREIKGN